MSKFPTIPRPAVPAVPIPAYVPGLNPLLVSRLPAMLNKLRLLTEDLRSPLGELALLVSELQDHLEFEAKKTRVDVALGQVPAETAAESLSTFATTMDRVDPAGVRVLLVEIEQLTRDLQQNYFAPATQHERQQAA